MELTSIVAAATAAIASGDALSSRCAETDRCLAFFVGWRELDALSSELWLDGTGRGRRRDCVLKLALALPCVDGWSSMDAFDMCKGSVIVDTYLGERGEEKRGGRRGGGLRRALLRKEGGVREAVGRERSVVDYIGCF